MIVINIGVVILIIGIKKKLKNIMIDIIFFNIIILYLEILRIADIKINSIIRVCIVEYGYFIFLG